MNVGISTTYYLLRTRSGIGPATRYVGLAPQGAHAIVPQPVQARRFATVEAAESYVCGTGKAFGDFEIEARTSE